jgi:hypothetical protein
MQESVRRGLRRKERRKGWLKGVREHAAFWSL